MTKPRIYSDKERKERRAILTRNYSRHLYVPKLKTSYLSYTGDTKKMLEEDIELQELFKQLTELHDKIEEYHSEYEKICQNKKKCIIEIKKYRCEWEKLKKKISIRREQILATTKNSTNH